MGITKYLEKFEFGNRKPRSHVRIVIYQIGDVSKRYILCCENSYRNFLLLSCVAKSM